MLVVRSITFFPINKSALHHQNEEHKNIPRVHYDVLFSALLIILMAKFIIVLPMMQKAITKYFKHILYYTL